MTPKTALFKVAFTGTNCSGKTTMALEVAARLKNEHILAEVVSSQDRKVTWKDEHFPSGFRAHYGMMSTLVTAEVQAELKGDATIVVTDRSLLDLYSIALTDHPKDTAVLAMEPYVRAWLTTYARVYFLEPLPYQDDGKRPPDDFRMRTFATLERLVDTWKLPNLVNMPRHEVMDDVRHLIGAKKPNRSVLAEAEKWQAIANATQATLFVKAGSWPSTSDIDVWVVCDDASPEKHTAVVRSAALGYFGDHYPCQVMAIPRAGINALLGKFPNVVKYAHTYRKS